MAGCGELLHCLLLLAAWAPAHAAVRKKGPSPRPATTEPCPSAPAPSPVCTGPGTLLWADEFDGPSLDGNSWTPYEGTFENQEMEFYTGRTQNVRIEDGVLVLEARQESFGGQYFTSGRIETRGKHAFVPGMVVSGQRYNKIRVEARMNLPKGQGMWPAFWLLPGDTTCEACSPIGDWPVSGEIDILEAINDMQTLFSTIHFVRQPSEGDMHDSLQGIISPASGLGLQWHTYAIEWTATTQQFFMDGMPFFTAFSSSVGSEGWKSHSTTAVPPGPNAPFDVPFYIILNLAVGGSWPGSPDSSTPWPQKLLVDWVRVTGW